MQTGDMIWLVAVALVVLGGLVSLGIGHRRWSIATVVAGILVLVSAATFLYLAARLASRDRAWARKVADYELKLAQATDGPPDPNASGSAEGNKSLACLRASRDRWRRGLDSVDTWRGRIWRNASFQPPKDDASTGRIELAADVNAEDVPPIGVGARVFLFDAIPFEDGGAYIGEFLVQGTSYDQATKRHVLTVAPTAARDAYDARVLGRPHDNVDIFEDLPVDRWLAFYRSRAADGAGQLPTPLKQDADTVRDLFDTTPGVGTLVAQFVETFRLHETDLEKEDWKEAEALAADQPGTLWAEVTFTKPHAFGAAGQPADAAPEQPAEQPADAAPESTEDVAPRQDFAEGDRAVFDLQTAVELRDRDNAVTIDRVFRRRPLTDAMTILHGGRPADDAAVEGTSTLRRLLEDEVASLDRSNNQLTAARNAAVDNTKKEQTVAGELTTDLESWRRDAVAAAELVTDFEQELGRTTRERAATEAAIVAAGRELTTALSRLAAEIDRVAPPPERRAARP